MPHPALGLPPSDAGAGQPEVAARLRAAADRLPRLSLEAALRIDPTLRDRYDELMLRRLLRDYDRHIRQLAEAAATGEERFVTVYAETLVPTYRRRHVRMNDVVTLMRGLEEAAISLGPAAEAEAIRAPMAAWVERLRRHRRLPGDHAGNRVARFIWKGAGLGDDTVV
jgi:hypothetical protein